MSIKSILNIFGGEAYELNALTAALAITYTSRATLRILHLVEPPVVSDVTGIGIYSGLVYGDLATVERVDQETKALTQAAKTYAEAYCHHQNVPLLSEGTQVTMGQAQAFFRAVTGDVRDNLPREASTADLIVTDYDNRPEGDLSVILTGLFNADRPVLAVPRQPASAVRTEGYCQTIMFAWDGSVPSGKALREAVAHMLHATNIFVVRVMSDDGAVDEQVRSDLITYLRSHCIDAEFLFVERDKRKVGEILLQEATRLKADMLVMGAYGRGHISEMLLGGVTDYVLKHANLPLLLAH